MVRPATTPDDAQDRAERRRGIRARGTPISAISIPRHRVQRSAGLLPRARRWLLADVHVALAIALGVPVLAGEAVHGFAGAAPILALVSVYAGLQVALGLAVPGGWRGTRSLVRFLLAVAFVGVLIATEPRVQPTLPVLFIPIITLASATSLPSGLVVAVAAGIAARLATAVELGPAAAFDQSILPFVVVGFLVLGTRQVVASLERSLERLRRIAAHDRRRARRLRAIEQLGRLLAAEGPSPAALETIMDVLVRTFGYHYTSVYLWSGTSLRLGAQRGYATPIEEFDLGRGIIGLVARTREVLFAPDVSRIPEYEAADEAVTSEIAVPLLADGELLGVLNVESTAADRLATEDLGALRTIADRLSASIALGRERTKLSERAELLGRLTEAFVTLGATLDPAALNGAIATAATTVVACEFGLLTLADPVAGSYRIAAAVGADAYVGMQIEPGEGATGRAIATRAAVLDDHFERAKYPKAVRKVLEDPAVAVMSVPMLQDDIVPGAITFVRRDPGHGFTEQEREVAALLAAQATLAVANARLHAETREAAIRDPLTQLHNRRLLDDALVRMSALRTRQLPAERRPVAAIMFDLDHFGDFNNRHGHLAGDAVLRAFAGLLASRFRASDLVTRYGGEEFLVILDGASRDDAVRAADEIRVAFAEIEIDGPTGDALRATVSAGCAGLDSSVANLNVMIEVADVGLAMAKSGGRNQVVAA